MGEALRILLIVGGTLIGLGICSIPLVGGAVIDRANRARMVALGYEGTREEQQDARIAGYEQEYVNGTLDLDGLDRAISGVLGLPIKPTVEQIAAERAEARERREGVLLRPPPKPSDAHRSVTPPWARTDSIPWTSTASMPATAAAPAPREVVELVDGSGQHISYVDVTPRGRPAEPLPVEPDPRLVHWIERV